MDTILPFLDNHGGALAALAALIAVPFLFWQIFQSAWHERRRLRRRYLAALATLPMTLSGIAGWTTATAKALGQIYPWVLNPNREPAAPRFEPPRTPDDLILAVERMIEASPNGRDARVLAAIVSEIQILSSRLRDWTVFRHGDLGGQRGMIDDNILLAASIYTRAESLFDRARNVSERAPLDYDRMRSALNIMDIRPEQFEAVHESLERRRNLQRRRGYETLLDGWRNRATMKAWMLGN
jgi:hypothetical protein